MATINSPTRRDLLKAIPLAAYTPVHMRTGETCRCDDPRMKQETNGKATWLVFICQNCGGKMDRIPVE